jgi:lysine-N-methylase
MTSILRNSLLAKFSCTGDACEDTCCKQWSMQMDDATFARYQVKAPELLDAVDTDDDGGRIMRKSPSTGYCVKLDGGICSIHKQYGDSMLGDACHFYPRATRALGDAVLMTATLSCPEIARLALSEDAWTFAEQELERLPSQMKNYLPEGLSAEDALQVHQAFLKVAEDESLSAEQALARIASVSRSFENIPVSMWGKAVGFYLQSAQGRLPEAKLDAADPFNLLHALCGLIVATHKPRTPRLQAVLDDMQAALGATLNWENASIALGDDSQQRYRTMQERWRQEHAAIYAPALRRWLKMQLALALFPFSGLGDSLSERITIIGVRLATLRLAIMCRCDIKGPSSATDDLVPLVQPLSRVLDHLGSSRFSLDVYAEPKWLEEARMLGLLSY